MAAPKVVRAVASERNGAKFRTNSLRLIFGSEDTCSAVEGTAAIAWLCNLVYSPEHSCKRRSLQSYAATPKSSRTSQLSCSRYREKVINRDRYVYRSKWHFFGNVHITLISSFVSNGSAVPFAPDCAMNQSMLALSCVKVLFLLKIAPHLFQGAEKQYFIIGGF